MLHVSDLHKQFGTHKAVNGISCEVAYGNIFGLLGPNGAGKTTLLRMITGIFYPDSGSIVFDGKPFNAKEDILHIGYMPEERGLYKKMKVGEHAIYLAQLKGLSSTEAKKQVQLWFEKFGMETWWNKKVQDLSKGMGQKLQFVSTILHQPKLVILDEPFSGLDPVNSNLIKDEIFNLAKNGTTVIFSTHRMEQVEEICNHIILVNKGEKILDGTVANIKQQFKEHIFKVSLSAPVDCTDQQLFSVIHQHNENYEIKMHPNVANNSVVGYFMNKDVQLQSFNEVLPSLNEIFIKQTSDTPMSRSFM
jgi:ABC-2 type transport system ATP-binding protein